TVVSNYWINLASSLVMVLACGFLIDRVLEPRLGRAGVPRAMAAEEDPDPAAGESADAEVSPVEKRALAWAGAVLLGLVAMIVALAVVPFSPWQKEGGGLLPDSPFMGSIVFYIVMLFSVTGIAYGIRAGTIGSGADIARALGQGLRSMTGFLVVAFALAQFLALFEWSGVGTYLAVHGAGWLESAQWGGLPIVLAFVVLCALANLLITSGTSMWGLMAVVFVPMLALTGIEPAFVQAAFRIGDSATQIITPLNPYLIVLLGMVRRYEPSAGLGTLVARLLPFTVVFFSVWTGVLLIFWGLDLPIGPANGIRLGSVGGPLGPDDSSELRCENVRRDDTLVPNTGQASSADDRHPGLEAARRVGRAPPPRTRRRRPHGGRGPQDRQAEHRQSRALRLRGARRDPRRHDQEPAHRAGVLRLQGHPLGPPGGRAVLPDP